MYVLFVFLWSLVTAGRAGFEPDRALFGKNVGAPPSRKFSDINVQKQSVDTCELHVRNIAAVI